MQKENSLDGTKKERTAIQIGKMLLLAVLVLALGSCFGGGGKEGGGGGGESATEEVGSGKTTSTQAIGGETTTAELSVSGGITTAELAVTNLELTPSRDSGVSGIARLTDTPGGVEVALNAQNLSTQPGTEHLAHIHEGGTCADDRSGNGAPVVYGLAPLYTEEDGTASSATSIAGATFGQLFSDLPKYVNVQAERTGEVAPPGIACVDLPLRGE